MRPVSELDESAPLPALDASRAGFHGSTGGQNGGRAVDHNHEPESGNQDLAHSRLGVLTSGGVYDEIRRKLALLGYRWD